MVIAFTNVSVLDGDKLSKVPKLLMLMPEHLEQPNISSNLENFLKSHKITKLFTQTFKSATAEEEETELVFYVLSVDHVYDLIEQVRQDFRKVLI